MRSTPAGDYDYEADGPTYSARRQADPRIAARVHAALGAARTVLNVGAGAGSYEPEDRHVVAVEPSRTMRLQRPRHLAPALDGTAEHLPFDDGAFDAAMATITIHQWADLDQGLRELRRVTRGPVVVLTIDGPALERFWLNDWFPEVVAVEQARFPSLERVAAALGGTVETSVVPVPLDCSDGFGEAYYGRPEAFLDPAVRRSQSGWGLTDPDAVARGVRQLEADLDSGRWDALHGHLRTQPEHEGALRLVTARP